MNLWLSASSRTTQEFGRGSRPDCVGISEHLDYAICLIFSDLTHAADNRVHTNLHL